MYIANHAYQPAVFLIYTTCAPSRRLYNTSRLHSDIYSTQAALFKIHVLTVMSLSWIHKHFRPPASKGQGEHRRKRPAKEVCHVGAQPELSARFWHAAGQINGGSVNNAPHNKNLVKSHSSHSGDPLGHRHRKMASVLCIYASKSNYFKGHFKALLTLA